MFGTPAHDPDEYIVEHEIGYAVQKVTWMSSQPNFPPSQLVVYDSQPQQTPLPYVVTQPEDNVWDEFVCEFDICPS